MNLLPIIAVTTVLAVGGMDAAADPAGASVSSDSRGNTAQRLSIAIKPVTITTESRTDRQNTRLPIYVPPNRGAARVRVGGATRGGAGVLVAVSH